LANAIRPPNDICRCPQCGQQVETVTLFGLPMQVGPSIKFPRSEITFGPASEIGLPKGL
jgi:hypothetical protein